MLIGPIGVEEKVVDCVGSRLEVDWTSTGSRLGEAEADWTSTNYLPQNHPRFHPIPLVLIETQNTKKHCQYGSLKLDMS
jgi:hypothetical protein